MKTILLSILILFFIISNGFSQNNLEYFFTLGVEDVMKVSIKKDSCYFYEIEENKISLKITYKILKTIKKNNAEFYIFGTQNKDNYGALEFFTLNTKKYLSERCNHKKYKDLKAAEFEINNSKMDSSINGIRIFNSNDSIFKYKLKIENLSDFQLVKMLNNIIVKLEKVKVKESMEIHSSNFILEEFENFKINYFEFDAFFDKINDSKNTDQIKDLSAKLFKLISI